MKISELPKLTKIRRDIEIPLAILGENRSVTMGQIMDAISKDVLPFDLIRSSTANVQYVEGAPPNNTGALIFDTVTNRFYKRTTASEDFAGQTVTTSIYWSDWDTRDDYYNEDDEVRTDCLFRAGDGRLYFFDEFDLKSAGITDEQALQIRHSTPIEVASAEEMQQRIEAGEYEAGQLYFLAEEG